MGTPGLHPFLECHAQASRPVVTLQGGKATPGACQIGGAETDAVGQHMETHERATLASFQKLGLGGIHPQAQRRQIKDPVSPWNTLTGKAH
jgi:hypothetical protein